MRKTLTTLALLLTLSCTALGGEMSTWPAPPPQPATATQEPMQVGTAISETPTGTADILKQIALNVFAVLPSLV